MFQQNTLKFYGEHFYEMGLNVSICSNEVSRENFLEVNKLKAPFNKWKSFQFARQQKHEFANLEWDKALGLGIILGYEGYAAIDIDGCIDYKVVEFILKYLSLPVNYTWVYKTGSESGFHILFKTTRPDQSDNRRTFNSLDSKFIDQSFGKKEVNAYYSGFQNSYNILYSYPFLKKIENEIVSFNNDSFFKIEFMWLGHVVVPSSLHNSGKLYEFLNKVPDRIPEFVDFETLSELQLLISGNQALSSVRNISLKANSDKDENETNSYQMVMDCKTTTLSNSMESDYISKDKLPNLLQMSWYLCISDCSSIALMQGQSPYLFFTKRECRTIKLNNDEFNRTLTRGNKSDKEIQSLIGEEIKDVLKDFVKDLESVKEIICFNYELNKDIIINEFIKNGIDPDLFLTKRKDCVMMSAAEVCKIGKYPYEYPTLSQLYFHLFNRRIAIKCTSLFAATITIKCYNKLLDC